MHMRDAMGVIEMRPDIALALVQISWIDMIELVILPTYHQSPLTRTLQ